jgi:hypothetical protein
VKDAKPALLGDYGPVNGDLTFYSLWEADEVVIDPTEYTVTFYDGETPISELTQTVAEGGYATLAILKDKPGFRFAGWSLEQDGDIVDFEYYNSVMDDLVFYACWTSIPEYTVTFYNGEDVISTLGGSYYEGAVIDLPIAWENMPDETIDGWLLGNAGDLLSGTHTVTADADFYVQWVVEACITITTATDLDNVRNDLDACYTLANDISLATSWEPIGSVNEPFTGTFDGGNFAISDMTIDATTNTHTGLFSAINNSTVMNIKLERVNITSGNSVGAIAGASTNSSIENCSSSGTITTEPSITTTMLAGGIVGRATNSIIRYCDNAISVSGDDYVGGIVGHMTGGRLERSSNTGSVSGEFWSGGVAGWLIGGSYLEDCYSTGDVSANGTINNRSAYAGGVVGRVVGSYISRCYSSGNVSASVVGAVGIAFSYAGGIAAEIYEDVWVEDCVALNPRLESLGSYARSIVASFKFDTQTPQEAVVFNNFALDSMVIDARYTSNTSDNSISKTESELKAIETYESELHWAFGNEEGSAFPWKWNEGQYPTLW